MKKKRILKKYPDPPKKYKFLPQIKRQHFICSDANKMIKIILHMLSSFKMSLNIGSSPF